MELLLENLNNNVKEEFLRGYLQKHLQSKDAIKHLSIAYHPTSKKHLGIAHVEFESSAACLACLKAMHGKSVMG